MTPHAWERIIKLASELEENISHLHHEDPESVRFGVFLDASRLTGFISGVALAESWEAESVRSKK